MPDIEKLKSQAETLLEALPYMQQFRGQTFVIKYGGAAMEDPVLVERALRDIVFLEVVGINPVIVHGGGKAITAEMSKAGLQAQFIDGMRVTDAASIEIVDRVLSTEINPGIVKTIHRLGGQAKGFSGRQIFDAEKMWLKRADGSQADLGFVGEVTAIRTSLLRECVEEEIVPVVSPVGAGNDGSIYNINADVAAAQTAIALRANKIIFISDVNGIMRNPKDPSSVIPTLTVADIATLKSEGIVSGGMLPKVDSCVKALQSGVGKVHLIDGRIPHSLVLELFTDSGIGTQILP